MARSIPASSLSPSLRPKMALLPSSSPTTTRMLSSITTRTSSLSSTPHGVDTARRKSTFILTFFETPETNLVSSLAPKYDTLGALYSENPEFASKVTVAKVDATANDVPDDISGFPTIKLFPAGAKDSPVDYSGSRTVEDLAKFIQENGKYKVDANAEAAKVDTGGDVTAAPGSQETAEAEEEEKAAEHEEL